MQQLHPGARWFFRLNTYFRFGFLFLILIIILANQIAHISKLSEIIANSADIFLITLLVGFISYIIIILLFGEIYARMAYNRWFYELRQDGIRIERGIIWKKFTSIPYERIQNVDIQRGIIARMLGFSTVLIQTAGQSSGYSYRRRNPLQSSAEGYLPAVDMDGAEKIREFIMKKVKQTSQTSRDNSGL